MEAGLAPIKDHCKWKIQNWKGSGVWHGSANPHQLVRQQDGHPGRCGGRLESVSPPDLQQPFPWCPCSWDSSVHMGLCLPWAFWLVLRSTVSGRRRKAALSLIIVFIKTVQIIKIEGFQFYCKVSNWSSVKTFLFIFFLTKWEIQDGHDVLHSKSILIQMHVIAYIHLFWTHEGILLAHLQRSLSLVYLITKY